MWKKILLSFYSILLFVIPFIPFFHSVLPYSIVIVIVSYYRDRYTLYGITDFFNCSIVPSTTVTSTSTHFEDHVWTYGMNVTSLFHTCHLRKLFSIQLKTRWFLWHFCFLTVHMKTNVTGETGEQVVYCRIYNNSYDLDLNPQPQESIEHLFCDCIHYKYFWVTNVMLISKLLTSIFSFITLTHKQILSYVVHLVKK